MEDRKPERNRMPRHIPEHGPSGGSRSGGPNRGGPSGRGAHGDGHRPR